MVMQHKIMLVDDDAHVIDSLSNILNAAGFDVVAVADESTVLEKVRAELPSLIILDLALPQVPGLEICKRLKDDVATRHIPVIMLTAKSIRAS